MVDRNRLLEAVELKGRILNRAAQRSHCWIIGDTDTARAISDQLDRDWQVWRTVYAEARGDGHKPYQPSTGSRATTSSEQPVDRFMATNCVRDPAVLAPVRQVYDAYQRWVTEQGEDSITPMRLTLELKRRGVQTARTKTTRFYRGLAVTASAHMPLATT
jgi:hypothetical protein